MTHHRHRFLSHRAFTLVELLVVIGVIAMLISILLPALGRARESAKTVTCASNLRQVGIALQLYAAGNRDAMPAWCAWVNWPRGSDPLNEDPNPAWTEQLAPYFVSPDSPVYDCPAFPIEARHNYFISGRWAGAMGRRNLKFSDIRLSTQYVLSGDCVTPEFYTPPFGTGDHDFEIDKDDETFKCLVFLGEDGGKNMHPAGNNVLFADGHVIAVRRLDLTILTFNPTKMQAWEDVPGDP